MKAAGPAMLSCNSKATLLFALLNMRLEKISKRILTC